jgi:hypothetical protein
MASIKKNAARKPKTIDHHWEAKYDHKIAIVIPAIKFIVPTNSVPESISFKKFVIVYLLLL